MQITRNSIATATGSREWFTGAVLRRRRRCAVERVAPEREQCHFTPGARTAWHTHPKGQSIWVTEGVGLAQRRGGPIEVIRPADRVFFERGEEHWHGAAPDRFMTHLALLDVDDAGNSATWGPQVSEDEYRAAPGIGGA